ncbi:MAG: T9SS type A sorting domain-containing protein [Bacteroidia bacterium]
MNSISPNPASNKVHFWREVSSQDARILVVDVMGKEILSANFSASETKLTLDFPYPSGVYFVEFSSSKGKRIQRLMIQH